MLDKLEMRTKEEIDLNILKNIFPRHQLCVVRDQFYKNCTVVKNGNKEVLTIKSKPIFGEAYESKIIVNPSKWGFFDQLSSVLQKLCNSNDLEIIRLDHAIDVSHPIERIFSGLRIKYKRDDKTFKENCVYKGKFLTGFYIGQKPEMYCIYDKGYECESSKKFKRNKDYERGISTRIELRQFRGKIKYNRLSELKNYVDDPPFSGIEFYEINGLIDLNYKEQQLRSLFDELGFSRAYAILNEHNNFNRNYGIYLKPKDFQSMLNKKYQDELHLFFGLASQQTESNKFTTSGTQLLRSATGQESFNIQSVETSFPPKIPPEKNDDPLSFYLI